MKFIIQIDNSVDKSLGKPSHVNGIFHFERESITQANEVFAEFKVRFPHCAYMWLNVDTSVKQSLTLENFAGDWK